MFGNTLAAQGQMVMYSVIYHAQCLEFLVLCIVNTWSAGPVAHKHYWRMSLKNTECALLYLPCMYTLWTWLTKKADKIYSSSGRQRNIPSLLLCKKVNMHVTPVLHNGSEGMFLCLPEELYILSAFFVSHIHSDMYLCCDKLCIVTKFFVANNLPVYWKSGNTCRMTTVCYSH